jgi:hypothetical protein
VHLRRDQRWKGIGCEPKLDHDNMIKMDLVQRSRDSIIFQELTAQGE